MPKHSFFVSSAGLSWGWALLALAALALAIRFLAPSVFWSVTAPFSYATATLTSGTQGFLSAFRDATILSEENMRLTQANTALEAENESLRIRLVEMGALEAAESIVAGVVVRPPVSPYDTLVLARGERAGVTLGMQAFGAGGVPVGVVRSVSSEFSHVLLFSAPGVRTLGWVGEGIALTLYGAGGGALRAELARGAGAKVGDTVYVPGPGKLPIGVVARIDDDPSAPAVSLRIVPFLNYASIGWVALRATGASPLESASPTASSTPP